MHPATISPAVTMNGLTDAAPLVVPETLYFDTWTGQYVGDYNDVWVRPRGSMWHVAFRDRGNVTVVVSKHRKLSIALARADGFIASRRAIRWAL
jgi:hypothetical protein